jgi:glucose/arabinose dehydrogenase
MSTNSCLKFLILVAALVNPVPVENLFAQTVVPSNFTVTTTVDNLDSDAIAFAQLPDGRFIIANQRSGDLGLAVSGSLADSVVGTVPDLESVSNERGLLAVAIDPLWPDSNYVYTYYTMTDGFSRVIRFPATGVLDDGSSTNLDIVVADRDTLLEMVDASVNHNGGSLRFGSDRSLYVSLGDDVSRGLVQNLTTLHGKIVRISPDPGQSLPSPNPSFPSPPTGALDEIFSIGLRNPFRFNIDPHTDRLLIGDVGQNSYEEVDLSEGGENFGWPRWEANVIFEAGQPLIPPDPTSPIFAYSHRPTGPTSVMGLATYRQKDFPNDSSFPDRYEGSHFIADFYYGPLWNLRPDAYGGWVADTFATGFSLPCDASLADDGGMYILEYGSAIKKISYDPGPVVTAQLTAFLEGAFLGSSVMDTTLLATNAIPKVQPFADSMYDATFLEFDTPLLVDSIPSGVVDWVLVDLRTATSAASTVARNVGFVRRDGTILGPAGEPGLVFPTVDSTSYYVVVSHRNHAAVMSLSAVDFSSGQGSWDFSTAMTQGYTLGPDPLRSLGGGTFGLIAGDVDVDGQITAGDFNTWLLETKSVLTGYVGSDFDLDGQVTASDFNLWLVNTKAVRSSQVPGY